MKIRTLIVDDMQLARQRLRRYLKDETDIEIIAECKNGREAVDAIKREKPDLVFLDVQMPETDGFEVIEKIGIEEMPLVIFVTAFDQFALQAFDVHALDYLLKPFDIDRLQTALKRARKTLSNVQKDDLSERLHGLLTQIKNEPKYVKRLTIKSLGRTVFVVVDEIDWIGASGNYLELHTGKKTHLVRETMAEMEEKLDPSMFVRIHRSTIVNLERIREMQPLFKGDQILILKDGTELAVSRNYREKLIAAIENG